MYYYFFGDSITQGLWDSRGGWVDRFKSHIQSLEVNSNFMSYNLVFNLGVDGDTTPTLLKRFESELKARLWPDETYCIVFAIGVNDTLYFKDGRMESNTESYGKQLTQLFQLARKYTHQLYCLDILPVDETKVNPLPQSSSGKCYSNKRIAAFNQVLYEICNNEKVRCVKVSEEFTITPAHFLADGIHPNDFGHAKIYKRVVQELKATLRGDD